MKVRIYETEWHPVTTYETLDDPMPEVSSETVEVPDEVIQAYDAARAEFSRAEQVLQSYCEKLGHRLHRSR